MCNLKKLLTILLLLCTVVTIAVTLSSCEYNGQAIKIPGWDAFKEEFGPHVHDMKEVQEIAPTCYYEGAKAYYTCSKCYLLFADAEGNTSIEAPEAIPMVGHTEEIMEAKAPTCTENGLTEGKKCSVCAVILEAPSSIDALGHTEVVDNAKAPTCTETGLTEGTHCSVCNTAIESQQIVPANGHSYDNDTDITCNVTGCGHERCLHTNTEAVGVATESTCSVQGMTAGEKCSDCGDILVAQEKLPLASHTAVAINGVAAGCIKTGLTAGSECSVCGGTVKAQETIAAAGHKWEGIGCTVCGAVKFEAESAVIETDIPRLGAGMQDGKTPESTNYPSGNGYVYYLTDSGNATLTFSLNSSKAGKAVLSFRMGLSSSKYTPSQIFSLTVNGTEYDYYESANFPKYTDVNVVQYFGWYEIEVAEIDLIAGANTIVLTRNEKGLNFDYIALRSTDGATIGKPDCAADGHNYGDWTVTTAPTYEAAGEIKKVCSACSDTQTATIPAVSTENGYTKVSSDAFNSTWEYTYNGEKLSITVEDVVLTTYEFTVGDNDPFVAANGGSHGNSTYNSKGYYEKTSEQTFTVTVNVEADVDVNFIILLARNPHTDPINGLISSVSVKDSTGTTTKVTVNTDTITGVDWNTPVDALIGTIHLTKGTNVITFTRGNAVDYWNYNVFGVAFESPIPVTLGVKE